MRQRGQTTLEAVLCLAPAALLAVAAGLLLWRGLDGRVAEHARFREAHRALARLPR